MINFGRGFDNSVIGLRIRIWNWY